MGMTTKGGAHPIPCPPGSSAGEDAGSCLALASPGAAERGEHSLGDTLPVGRPCPMMPR